MNMSFYIGALGADKCTDKLSVISNNLANVNTAGFKPKTAVFSQLINYNLDDAPGAVTQIQAGAGIKVRGTSTSFDAGGMTETGSPYDYAITGANEFFMVQDPASGEKSFTRNGHFHRGERDDGFYLMTESGKLVLDQNQEPLKLDVLDIDKLVEEMENGYQKEDQDVDNTREDDQDKPKVSLYTFTNPSRLQSTGNDEFTPGNTGMAAVLVNRPSLVKGSLETSGTDVAKELTRLIECQRAFSYATRMITTSDEIEGTINSLRS